MTSKEDILHMAKEAGVRSAVLLHIYGKEESLCRSELEELRQIERFAALVRADEREQVAAWMMQRGYATGHGDTVEDLLKELEWQIRESEREACAKACDDASDKALALQSGRQDDLGSVILRHHAVAHQSDAAVIRARMQA